MPLLVTLIHRHKTVSGGKWDSFSLDPAQSVWDQGLKFNVRQVCGAGQGQWDTFPGEAQGKAKSIVVHSSGLIFANQAPGPVLQVSD